MMVKVMLSLSDGKLELATAEADVPVLIHASVTCRVGEMEHVTEVVVTPPDPSAADDDQIPGEALAYDARN